MSADEVVAVLRCEPSGREMVVAPGTPILEAVVAMGLPLGQSCDGEALCGFCRVQVVAGEHELSPVGDEERKVLVALHAERSERLACCARIHGRVTVTTTYW